MSIFVMKFKKPDWRHNAAFEILKSEYDKDSETEAKASNSSSSLAKLTHAQTCSIAALDKMTANALSELQLVPCKKRKR